MTDEEIEKLPNWMMIPGGIVLAAFFLWLGITRYQQHAAMSRGVGYTIGYVTKTGYVVGPSSHTAVSFAYEVNGRRYTSTGSGEPIYGCRRCLVKFATRDPQVRTFYNLICVPEDVPPPPPEGWPEPPFYVRAGTLD